MIKMILTFFLRSIRVLFGLGTRFFWILIGEIIRCAFTYAVVMKVMDNLKTCGA